MKNSQNVWSPLFAFLLIGIGLGFANNDVLPYTILGILFGILFLKFKNYF
ncbi:MAG: hypothetical protein KJ906_03635 [Nanoarchaeota archaeon]|nr:hypothetical protein [Nanoarchaeota archaeon]